MPAGLYIRTEEHRNNMRAIPDDELSFVQVMTGEYTYKDKEGNQEVSHAIYGLNRYGRIYKYVPIKKTWIRL